MLTFTKYPTLYSRILCSVLLLCLALVFAVSASADVYINQPVPEDWYQRNLLRLTQFKLGANDGMLLEVDGLDGGTKGYNDEVTKALQERGIERVNYIFNTHPHADHIACQYRLVRDWLGADEFLSGFAESYRDSEHLQERMVKILRQQNIPYRQVFHGETMNLGSAVLTFYQAPTGDLNARSIITHVRYGEKSTALLTADISGVTQHWCVDNIPPEMLDVDILKEPHHGLVQMVPTFVEGATPGFVFVTHTKNGSDKATAQLKKREIPHLHSASGTITMETDGVDWYVFQTPGKL